MKQQKEMSRFIFLVLSLIGLIFIGCNNKGTEFDNNEVSTDSLSLHIAVMPTVHCLPFFVAEKCGMYDEAGLDVVLDIYEAAMDADTAFVNRHIDILATDVVKYVHLNKMDKLSVLLNYDMDLFLMASSESGIVSKDSIMERVVAVARNSWDDMAVDEIAEDAGIERDNVNRPQINNIKLRADMLTNSQFDAAILPEPYASMCESKGCARLCGTSGYTIKAGVLVVRDSLLNARKNEMEKLVGVYNAAVDSINRVLESGRSISCYFPSNMQLGVPDSLLKINEYSHSVGSFESVISLAKSWTDETEWLKRANK